METPPIGERVQFWEEQDRINKELIPRVLKINELLTNHIDGHESAIAQIARLESQLAVQNKENTRMRSLAIGIATFSLLVAIASIIFGMAS